MKHVFKRRWVIMALCITALILVLGACGKDSDPTGGTSVDLSGIDWDDHRDFSIKITNNTTKDLVAFQEALLTTNMIGGVRAGRSNQGLKHDPAVFPSKPRQFKMIFITREQYEANKDTLSLLNNEIFTQMWVFWNGDSGDNTKVYEISSKLGGEYSLIVQNESSFDVELRVIGPSGPILGFAPHGIMTTKLNVGGGELVVFPVFKKVNTVRDIIETIVPTRENGSAWRQAYVFEGNPQGAQSLNLKTALSSISSRSSGVCYLKIYNNIANGAIGFMKGTSIQVRPSGNSMFNSGTSQEYVIEMPTVSGSDSFASEIQIDNFSIFQSGDDETLIRTVENNSSSMTLKADKLYIVNVSGDFGSIGNPVRALVELREGETGGPTQVTFSNLW